MNKVLIIDATYYPLVRAWKPLPDRLKHLQRNQDYFFSYYDYQPEDQGGSSGVHCKWEYYKGGKRQ